MKSKFLGFLLPLFHVFGNPDFMSVENFHQSNSPLYISLGAFCEMALRLKDCGLRQAAFPFDWLITKEHKKFLDLFKNDFELFTDENYFSQLEDRPDYVKNSRYEIYFTHDWPFEDKWSDSTRFAQQLSEIKHKYERRINRFRQIKQYPGKVFFFRTFWCQEGPYVTSEQAQELKNTLDQYFEGLNFNLVIVNYTDSNAPAIEGIPGAFEFKIRREYNLQDFQSMCHYLHNFALNETLISK